MPLIPTNIIWADCVLNAIGGCTPISPGCQNCYAAQLAMTRLKNHKLYQGLTNDKGWNGKLNFNENVLKNLDTKVPKKIFVASMSDLFQHKVPFGWLDEIFDAMDANQQHKYLLLTKRPKNMEAYIINRYFDLWYSDDFDKLDYFWFGMTAENQEQFDKRMIPFSSMPGNRFLSLEPLLEPINLHLDSINESKFDWVIVGCESGTKRRPCKLEWIRDIVAQCKAANVPVLVKQLEVNGRETSNLELFPKGLQVRQWPEGMEVVK